MTTGESLLLYVFAFFPHDTTIIAFPVPLTSAFDASKSRCPSQHLVSQKSTLTKNPPNHKTVFPLVPNPPPLLPPLLLVPLLPASRMPSSGSLGRHTSTSSPFLYPSPSHRATNPQQNKKRHSGCTKPTGLNSWAAAHSSRASSSADYCFSV